MIKINLALKKRAAAVDVKGGGGGAKSGFQGVRMPKLDADLLKEPQVRKLLLCIVVALLAYYSLDSYKNDQLATVDTQIAKANTDYAAAQAALTKTAGYEAVKKQLDEDENLIRTKLVTIQKLMLDREVPPKLLLSISNLIPKEAWLLDFELDEKTVKLQGSSLGFDPITDFMKVLSDSEFISDVKLVNTQKAQDQVAGEIANFELEAKRK